VNLGRVTGSCVATVKACGMVGHKLLLVQPLDFDLQEDGLQLVAVDTVAAGPGELVAFVRSREAANSLSDAFCAVDAAIVAIVDDLGMMDLDSQSTRLTWWKQGSS
jgi:microcompartment protein CcmK/EutM